MEQIPHENIPIEILEWARQHIDEEQILAELREVRETGGLELNQFIGELEVAAATDDRTSRNT